MGAIVDRTQFNSILGYIESGQAEGARLLTGGQAVKTESGGTYIMPTIFDGVQNSMKIAREEIFGPVLSVLSFVDFEQAIRAANASTYGLAAGLWTGSLKKAHLGARALRAGTIHVNSYDDDDITVPFGGFGQSGNGRDKSLHAFDKYTELKLPGLIWTSRFVSGWQLILPAARPGILETIIDLDPDIQRHPASGRGAHHFWPSLPTSMARPRAK